jgi:Putative cyclase
MPSDKRQSRLVASLAVIAVICAVLLPCKSDAADNNSLWGVYEQALKGAKYVDLTHTITPNIPVWAGFADSTFAPAKAGADIEGFAKSDEVYTYAKHGFEATEYILRADQFGTQLDPPAHWAPEYPAIDELPATYAIRPLVVISIVERKDQPELRPPGVRHRGVGKGAWPHTGGLRCLRALRLVEGVA